MTSAQIAWCADWCRAHASSWQILNRSRWKYQFHARTMVRFVEEVNLREEEVEPLLEYLASEDCRETLQLYDQSIGAEWTPTRAWLEISNKSHGNIHAVRLYHALQTDSADSEMFFVEDGCAYKVWLTYHWNEAAVEQPVRHSESGISYRISGISRDPDTGLYSYVVEKRERVQQDIAEYVTSETVYETRKEEQHNGVKADRVDSTGKAAGVDSGTITTRKLSKNEDCTTDVSCQSVTDKPVQEAQKRVEKTWEGVIRSVTDKNQPQPAAINPAEMKPGSSATVVKTDSGLYDNTVVEVDETPLGVKGEDCRKTAFEHTHATTENVPDRPTIDAPSAAGGVVVRQSASMTRYGTWDVHTTTDTEFPVGGAVESASKTLRAVRKSRTDRNQSAPLSMDGLEVGESRQSRMTEGGLYDNTVEQTDRTDVGDVGSDCAKTMFSHSDTTHENVATRPESEAEEAGGGKVTRKSVRETELGTFDVATTTETELSVGGASETVSVTLNGTTKVVENRNMPGPASTEGIGVGGSVTNTVTPGGRYNQTIRTVVRDDERKVGENCGKTIFEHTHGTENLTGADPGEVDATEAGDGKVTRKSVAMTADGAYRVSESTTTELPVSEAVRTVRKTLNGTVIREENRNQRTPAPEDGLRIGDSVTNSKTAGGLYNTITEFAPSDGAGVISERCHQDNFLHTHTQTENKGADAADEAEHSFENGVIVDKSVALQPNGTKDVMTSTTTPKPWIQRYDWWSGNSHHYVVKYGNQSEEFAGERAPADADSVSESDSVNPFGLHDGNMTWAYGPWSSHANDLKFVKHGTPQKFYVSWRKKFDRKRYHRELTVETVHIRGDAYTDFLSAEASADESRSTSGVLATKLLSTYSDKDRNHLAEWVELRGFWSAEKLCDGACRHGEIDNASVNDAVANIVRRFTRGAFSGADGGEGGSATASAIERLANMLMTRERG